jgi:hypothetical protein
MIHGKEKNVLPVCKYTMAYPAFDAVRAVFRDRGYDTVDALKCFYPDSKQGAWVIVQELQNVETLTSVGICYRVGSRGGVSEKVPGHGFRSVNLERAFLSFHAMPADGLYFWQALRDAGYDDEMVERMSNPPYTGYLW